MAALAVEPAAPERRPRFAPPVEGADAPAFAWPKNDRMSLQRKVALLSDLGLWRQMDALASAHGWHSVEVCRFIDAHLPKGACAHCGGAFYAYSRRIKHCSDHCRRAHAAHTDPDHAPKTPAPEPPTAPPEPSADDLCVWLARDDRFYLLLVVRDLFGAVALIRRWGQDGSPHPQQTVTTYATLADALAALDRQVATQAKRGYRRAALPRGRGDLLRRAYQAAGLGARQ